MTLGTTLRVTVFPGRDLQARHSRSLSLDRDLHCQAQNHSPALPPLCCPSSLCVCLCARVCMRAFCVSVCVCVCFLSLLECYPRHDKTVTVCRRVLPSAHHRRSRSSDRDLQRRAQSPLPPFLLSSCPPPPYFLLMSLHVTYTSPPTCICPVSSPPAPFSFCPPHFAA